MLDENKARNLHNGIFTFDDTYTEFLDSDASDALTQKL